MYMLSVELSLAVELSNTQLLDSDVSNFKF